MLGQDAVMDLAAALQAMRTRAVVPVHSDADLVSSVQTEVISLIADAANKGVQLNAKPVTIATGVHGSLAVRPLDAMLALARATRPLVSDDVFDWYRHWSWLRYLGIFDGHGSGNVGLSPAGRAVRANQRRVLSEDLGVGFGVVVAHAWCRSLGASGPIATVDVDLALREGRGWFRRHGAGIAVGDRQPDYLLVAADPNNPQSFLFKSLECKGTNSRSNVTPQLARAITQLTSLQLSGTTPQGIAVSTVSNTDGVRCFAVDPENEERRDTVTVTPPDLERARQWPQTAQPQGRTVDIPAAEFVAGSLLLSLGTLADYAGNNEAAREFLPQQTLSRLARRTRDRVTRETPDGVFRGIDYQFPAPGGQSLRVFMGIEDRVDDALSRQNVEAVMTEQSRFSREHPQRDFESDLASATGADGAILILDAE